MCALCCGNCVPLVPPFYCLMCVMSLTKTYVKQGGNIRKSKVTAPIIVSPPLAEEVERELTVEEEQTPVLEIT